MRLARARARGRRGIDARHRVVALALTCVLWGCGLPTGETFTYTLDSPELANAGVEGGVWQSVPWEGASWLPFPPRATVELEHTLGRAPQVVLVYLAFDPEATAPALAAGDLARVVEVTPTTVTVRNDTNAGFYFRVVAF